MTKDKLKTLKDIIIDCENGKFDIDKELNYIKLFDAISEEAIKWVKEMQQTLLEGLSIPTAIEIMTIFHNITEEDLK